MTEKTDKRKPKAPPTPQQAEIARLRKKGRGGRSDQENARLDQLVSQERRERFLRLAPKRVQNVLEGLRRLAACGNASSYQYTEEEYNRIATAIAEAMNDVDVAFRARKEEKVLFKL